MTPPARHPFPLLLPAALPLLLGACSQSDNVPARIYRLPGAEQARIMPVSARPLWTAHVHDAGGHVPADYGDFTSLPNYPRTYKVWKDEAQLQEEGPRRVEIDLASQRGLFLVNGEVAMDFPVCTGTERKPTPTGTFRITQKDVDHVSNIYDVPMPYFMRLTDYGIGLHVGDVFRSPASHGCIRLTREACVPLYRHAPSGTRVHIRRSGWRDETERAIRLATGEEELPGEDEGASGEEGPPEATQGAQLARSEG